MKETNESIWMYVGSFFCGWELLANSGYDSTYDSVCSLLPFTFWEIICSLSLLKPWSLLDLVNGLTIESVERTISCCRDMKSSRALNGGLKQQYHCVTRNNITASHATISLRHAQQYHCVTPANITASRVTISLRHTEQCHAQQCHTQQYHCVTRDNTILLC